MEEQEDRVIYEDGGEIRAITGRIVDEDDIFFHIQRRDGLHQVAKRVVIKVHRRNGGERE